MIHTPVYHSPRPLSPIIPQLPLSIIQLSTNLKVPRLFSLYFFFFFFFESDWKFDWNHSIEKSLKIIPFFFISSKDTERREGGREGRSFHLCTFRVTLSSNIFSFLNRLKDEGRKTRTFAYFNFIAKPWFIHLPPGKGDREWKLLVRQYSGSIFRLYLLFYFIHVFILYWKYFPYVVTRNVMNIMFM